jgi:tyrosinase
MQTPYIHFVGHFILWHRYFVNAYEKALREECGYTGGQPYWNYGLDAEPQNPESTRIYDSEIFQPDTGFGGNGIYVEHTPENNPFNISGATGGGCVVNGPFAPPNFMVNYPTPSCLRRDFIPTLLNSWADPKLEQQLLDTPDYTTFDRVIEGQKTFEFPNIHGSGHFGVGGVLGQAGDAANSPAEPLFYMHHGNLDRIFWRWQQLDLKTRLHQVGGPIMADDYSGKNVTLDFKVNLGKLGGDLKLSQLLNTEGGELCYTY